MRAWLALEFALLRRRLLGLLGFGALFIAAAGAARLVAGADGVVEFDAIMRVGGYPALSALLLTGWVVGRFPMVAALVLTAGIYGGPRDSGLARLLEVRPRPPLLLAAFRLALALVLALALSLAVLVVFDVTMLGRAPGPAMPALALAQVLAFGGLTALLSTFVRGDAWVAAALAVAAATWQALLRGGVLATAPPGIREVVGVLLPPQGALLRLEAAFGGDQAVPWSALAYVAAWAALALLLAGVIGRRREL